MTSRGDLSSNRSKREIPNIFGCLVGGCPKMHGDFFGPGDFFEFWYQPLNSKKAIPKDTVPISAFVGEMTGESSW